MKAARVALGLCGVALVGYGVLLLSQNPPVIIFRIVVWTLVAVVLHDFVFAPLCAVAGFAGRRLLPAPWRAPVAVASLCSVVLVLLAVPVYGRPGARPDNLTVLDRNYPLGLWISIGVVWLGVPGYYLVVRLAARVAPLPVGQDEVVEHQRTDHVDRQPPAPRTRGQ